MNASAEDSSRTTNQLRVETENDMDDLLFNTLASPASTAGSSIKTPLTAKSGFNARRRGTFEDTDYLMGPIKSVHRRRADPRVSFSSILNEIFLELKALPGSNDLLQPVNARLVTDYYQIVKQPMDLQQVRTRITENKYELRSQFLSDLGLILNNSTLYNGKIHPITNAATQVNFCGL
jgi:transcription initiation factor TFIID subunit 1